MIRELTTIDITNNFKAIRECEEFKSLVTKASNDPEFAPHSVSRILLTILGTAPCIAAGCKNAKGIFRLIDKHCTNLGFNSEEIGFKFAELPKEEQCILVYLFFALDHHDNLIEATKNNIRN